MHSSDPPATPPAPRPKRTRRWRRRLVGMLAALAIAGCVVHFIVLPWVVRVQLKQALADAGYAGAHFDVARVTPWGTRINDLTAGDGALKVGSLDVTYGPVELISARLRRVTLDGVEVRVSIRDGKIVLPKSDQREPADAGVAQPAATAPAPGEDGSESFDLPFQALSVASSAVTVDWDGRIFRVPLTAMIERTGPGAATARVDVRVESPAGDVDLPGGAKLRGPPGVLLLDAALEAGVSPAGAGSAWRVTGRVGSDGTPMLTANGVEVNPGKVRVSGHASGQAGGDAGAAPVVRAEVAVDGAGVRLAESGLALAGIDLRMPVSVNANASTQPGAGSFAIASAELRKHKLAPASGTLAVRNGRLEFSAGWAALPGSMLTAEGWVSRGNGGIEGALAANVPTFTLDDGDALARLATALEGWTVTGDVGADAKLTVAHGRPTGRVNVALGGARMTSKEADVEMEGVAGALDVIVKDGEVSTPPGQRITAARAAMGTTEFKDLLLRFSLAKSDALLLERVEAGWLGGRVSAAGVTVNPAEPKFEATLVAERLGLRELLAFAAPERARGEGLMSGRVPVKVDWPRRVAFGTGYLRSQSPTGELQVLDTKWLSDTMDASDPRFTTDRELAEVKQRVVRALADFAYDRLTFDFAEEPAVGGLLRVSTHGKGRVGERPQELDLTLNIRGVSDLLDYGLRGKQKYDELTNPKIGR